MSTRVFQDDVDALLAARRSAAPAGSPAAIASSLTDVPALAARLGTRWRAHVA